MTGRTVAIIVGCVMAAFVLDWLLMLWLRRKKERAQSGMTVAGQYSPVLSWLTGSSSTASQMHIHALPEVQAPEKDALPSNGGEPDTTPEETPAEPPDPRRLLRAVRGWLEGLFTPPEGGVLFPQGAPARRLVLIEIALIVLVVLAFCQPFLDLRASTILPGNETESFQALDQFLYDSIRSDGRFPLWNPYYFAGLPFMANPMFHSFSPVVTLPVLLFGPDAGFKLAMFLSFVIGALGMWWLCAIFGMGSVARVWMALVFAFAGQPVARFFQGEYLFVLGWAWLPWALASLVALFRTHRRLYAVMASASLALIFFSGNAYYAFFIAFVAVIFMLAVTLKFRRKVPFITLDRQRLALLVIVGLVALGMAAAQLLPTAQMWDRISKAGGVVGSHTLTQIWLDFTSKNTVRPDAYTEYPAREEFYAYIGVLPFLPLVLLPLALVKRWRRDKRLILFLFALLLFTLLWIDTRQMPWAETYASLRAFSQFRHQVRMIIFTELVVLLLAGMSLEVGWRWLWQSAWSSRSKVIRAAAGIGCAALVGLAVISSGDIFLTNRPYTRSVPRAEHTFAAFEWLRGQVDGWTYFRHNANNTAWLSGMVSGAPLLEPQYSFDDIRSGRELPAGRRPIRAHPNYVLQAVGDPDPEAVRLADVGGYEFFYFPENLPFAFSVANAVLDNDLSLGEVKASEVNALDVYGSGTRSFEVIADGDNASTLVLLVTDFPGWQLEVDGKVYPLQGYNGYLSAAMPPGVHQYTFVFRPNSFYGGVFLSLISLLLAGWWLWRDAQLNWQPQLARLKHAPRAGWAWLAARPDALRARFARPADGSPLELNLLGLSISVTRKPRIAPATTDRSASLARWMFIAALLVYAFTRLYALDKFPIYFFADEATNTLYAENLLANDFKDPKGGLLPIYFEADGNRWTPLLSVYPQVVSLALFGKSVLVTRATSALISLLAAVAVSLMLKHVFKVRYWWLGALVMALIPAWFLHSRTAFETAMMTSFYAVFLLFYLLYRTRSPRFLFPALVMGAATFYTYSNGQVIMGVTGILLLVSDIRYHLKNWRVLLPGLALGVVLAVPLILFRINEPTGIGDHLHAINSFVFQAIPLQEKVVRFTRNYLYGLSPQYWFFANSTDLARHRMDSYGHIWTLMLPLFLLGVGLFLQKIKSAPHRAILLAALTAPAGASLADIGITRMLSFVIPAGLLIAFGIDWLVERSRRWFPERAVALVVALGLALASFGMLGKSLTQGPLWFTDYGLYGMQYGATQLFEDVIPRYLEKDPNNLIFLTSSWANASDRFITFFLPPEQRGRVVMEGVQTYTFKKQRLDDSIHFIMSSGELKLARESGKFKRIDVLETVPYPDGSPGFFVVKMAYVDDIDQVFVVEKEERRKLVEDKVTVGGRELILRHSMLDMGIPSLVFDNDTFTLMRGLEANPFVMELDFPTAETISSVYLDCGTINMQVSVTITPAEGGKAQTTVQRFDNLLSGATRVEIPLEGGSQQAIKLRVEILATNYPTDAAVNVHVREFGWDQVD